MRSGKHALQRTVAHAMSTEPLWMAPDDTLDRAEVAMALAESRHVPVVSDGKLEGIVSVRDILAAQGALGLDGNCTEPLRRMTARQVMTTRPIVVGSQDDLVRAAQLMREHSISSLPVVDEDELVGIVTSTDLIEEAVHLLAEEERASGKAPSVARLVKRRPVSTIGSHETVDLAVMSMKVGHFRHLPVLEGHRLVGIISDRDILRSMGFGPAHAVGSKVRSGPAVLAKDIMEANVRTTTLDDSAKEAGRTLVDLQIGALPVLRSEMLIGFLTEADYIAYLITCSPSEISRGSDFHTGGGQG